MWKCSKVNRQFKFDDIVSVQRLGVFTKAILPFVLYQMLNNSGLPIVHTFWANNKKVNADKYLPNFKMLANQIEERKVIFDLNERVLTTTTCVYYSIS